MSIRKG